MWKKMAVLAAVVATFSSLGVDCSPFGGLGGTITGTGTFEGVYRGTLNAERTEATFDGTPQPDQTSTLESEIHFSAGKISYFVFPGVCAINETLTAVGQTGNCDATLEDNSQQFTWTVTALQYGNGTAHLEMDYSITINAQQGTEFEYTQTGTGYLTADFTGNDASLETTQRFVDQTDTYDVVYTPLHHWSQVTSYDGTMNWSPF